MSYKSAWKVDANKVDAQISEITGYLKLILRLFINLNLG